MSAVNRTETASRRAATGLTVVLALAAVGLGVLLWWQWQQGLALERSLMRWRKLPSTPVAPLALAPDFRLPDAQAGFPEWLSRPLFWAGRRPMADGTKSGPTAFKKGQFLLVGVVVGPQYRGALLRDVETGKTEAVAEGAQIRGITLGDVAADRAVLRLGADTEELLLALQRGSRGAGPATATPAGTPPGANAATAGPPAGAASPPPGAISPPPAVGTPAATGASAAEAPVRAPAVMRAAQGPAAQPAGAQPSR